MSSEKSDLEVPGSFVFENKMSLKHQLSLVKPNTKKLLPNYTTQLISDCSKTKQNPLTDYC